MKAHHVVTLIGFLGVMAVLVSVAVYKELAIYVSIVALGLAMALQKYVTSFLSYFMIYYGKLFKPGDRVRIGSIKGDVRSIGFLHTDLEEVGDDQELGDELTGRIVHIPNLAILDQPILNYANESPAKSRPENGDYLFDEVRIPITTTSDIYRAKAVLEDILKRGNNGHAQAATSLFDKRHSTFMREAGGNPKVQIYLEPNQVWLKGKFVTRINDRNSLRTQILLDFLSECRKLNGEINLA